MENCFKKLSWLLLSGYLDLLACYHLTKVLTTPVPLQLSVIWQGFCVLGFTIGNKLIFDGWDYGEKPVSACKLSAHAKQWGILRCCLHVAVSTVICILFCNAGYFVYLALPVFKLGLSLLCVRALRNVTL